MLKKTMGCCASLGAALAMLVGIPFGNAVGDATDAALRVYAQSPGIVDTVFESLELALQRLQLPLILVFAAAVILLILSRVCTGGICCKPRPDRGTAFCIYTSVSAAIALFGCVGTILANGTIAVTIQSVLVLQPSEIDTINEIAGIGARSALLATVFSVIIAAGIMICMLSSCRRPMYRCTSDEVDVSEE